MKKISSIYASDEVFHCAKSVQIQSFSCPYFLAFGLNTERYSLSFRIHSECGKIRTRKNYVFGHFSRSVSLRISFVTVN